MANLTAVSHFTDASRLRIPSHSVLDLDLWQGCSRASTLTSPALTMTSTSPSPSSSAAALASTSSPTCTEPFCPSSHFWIGLIGVGFLIIFNVCLIKWRMSWREMGSFCCLFCGVFCCIPSNQNVNTRVQNENVPPARSGQPVTLDQPEMFDARMGERALDGLKWEKSMVSITLRLGFGDHLSQYNSLWFITAVLRDDVDGPRV